MAEFSLLANTLWNILKSSVELESAGLSDAVQELLKLLFKT
jgi:hypothetical protein